MHTDEHVSDYIEALLNTILQLLLNSSNDGDTENDDILVFLPGQEEIENLSSLLKYHLGLLAAGNRSQLEQTLLMDDEHCKENDCFQSPKGMGMDINNSLCDENSMTNAFLICVLCAKQQLLAFEPKPNNVKHKVILANNINKTSLALSGICYVVNAGKAKIRNFCSSTNDNGGGVTGMESLIVLNISKAQIS